MSLVGRSAVVFAGYIGFALRTGHVVIQMYDGQGVRWTFSHRSNTTSPDIFWFHPGITSLD